MKSDKWKQFVLSALLAAVASIIVGLVFFGRMMFNEMRIGFQFFSFGIGGGILFSSFRFLKKWIAAVVFLVLIVLIEFGFHHADRQFIWQDALYFVALSGSILLFAKYYFEKLVDAVFSRILSLSSLLAAAYVLVAVIFYFVFAANPAIPRFNLSQMIYYDIAQGYLLGFGLGAGIEFAEFVAKRTILKPTEEKGQVTE